MLCESGFLELRLESTSGELLRAANRELPARHLRASQRELLPFTAVPGGFSKKRLA